MTLPTSGPLSVNDIHIEAGGSSGSLAGLNDEDIRDLIGKASGETSAISEFYGAAAGGNVEIRAWGGWGGTVSDETDGGRGKGRRLTWIGTVISGTRIELVAGGNGTPGQAYWFSGIDPFGCGGGGASTAYIGNNEYDHTHPLLIAGGGGGSGVSTLISSGPFSSAGGFANANGPGAGESPVTTNAFPSYVAPQGGNLNGSGSGGAGGSLTSPDFGVLTGGAGTAWSNGTGGFGGDGFVYGSWGSLVSLGGRSIYQVSGGGGGGSEQLLGLYDQGSSGGGGGYGGGGGATPNGTGAFGGTGGPMLGGAAGGSELFSQPSLGATYESTSDNGSLSTNSGGRIELWVDGVKVKELLTSGNSAGHSHYTIP